MITPREGSTLYYSLLWTPATARQCFLNHLTLIQTLATTLDDVQEPRVAEHKIHWWHEELQRLFEGQARHPATQAAQASLAGNEQAKELCLGILTAAATSRFTPPSSETEADRLLEQGHLARLALLAFGLSEDNTELEPQRHATQLALAMGRLEQLLRLPQLLHRGHPVFSDETYQRFGIRPADLASHIRVGHEEPPAAAISSPGPRPMTGDSRSSLETIPVVVEKPSHQALLNAVMTKAHGEISAGLAEPDNREHYRRTPLMPLWRLFILRERQLALWQRKPPDLLRERRTLTPLHKLFWSWRNRR